LTARYIVGDVLDTLRTLPDASVDLVFTSPPFLALRSYLPADHPLKSKEIGSEPTPGEFIDVLLDVTEELARVLAPHGSLCFELGDTYSGSGGAGGDYTENGLRAAQPAFSGSAYARRVEATMERTGPGRTTASRQGWPLDKSLCLIPELYRLSLAYGQNLLTGRLTDPWRVRNVVRWHRPNPPVGALGDKFRPATSDVVVACKSRTRYFDLDAVRNGPSERTDEKSMSSPKDFAANRDGQRGMPTSAPQNPAGAPPLDTWIIPTAPYRGVWQGDTLYRASQDCPEHSLRAIRQRLHTGSSGELREALLRNSRRTDTDRALTQHAALLAKSNLDDPAVRHAMTDWLDQSIRSEQTPESNGVSKTRSAPGRSDQSLGTEAVAARKPVRTGYKQGADSSLDQMTEMLPLEYGDAAIPHNTSLSKTVRVLVTTPADTPCAQTPCDIADTSESPASSALDESTVDSKTSGASHPSPVLETDSHTVRITHQRCSCEQYTESTSHYATFPPALVVKPLLAMCPERVCTVCGEPSRRIVGEAEYVKPDGSAHVFHNDGFETHESGANRRKVTGADNGNMTRSAPTLGWTDCGHNSYRAGVILDPFAGSGTVLSVASGHGRDSIGIDIDKRNTDLALERVGMFLTVEWPEHE